MKVSITGFLCIACGTLMAAGGCSNEDDTNAMGQGSGCVDTTVEVVADQVTDLGFSAEDILGFASGEFQDTFAYTAGGTTNLTLNVALDGTLVRYVESEPDLSGEETGLGMAPVCEDRLEIDVTVTFVTEDGMFNETWDATLIATSADAAWFNLEVDPDGLQGAYTLEPPEGASENDVGVIVVSASFDPSGTQGTVSAQFSGSSEDTEEGEGVAWSYVVDIGQWPAGEEGAE